MRARLAVVVASLAVVAGGCGGGDSGSTATTDAAVTSAPAASTAPAVTKPPATAPTTVAAGPPEVLVVGDSTLLAVEWYDRFHAFGGFELTFDAKSCRTVGVPSCSVPPPAPPNVVETIEATEGPFDMVVVMAGYDEWWTSFPSSFDAAVAAARAKGAARIVWLTYVESPVYLGLATTPLTEALEKNNATIRDKVAGGDYPDVTLADWDAYVADHPDWLEPDGIHLTYTGATGVADFISRQVAFLAGLPCSAPSAPGGPIADPCPDPATIEPIADILAIHD